MKQKNTFVLISKMVYGKQFIMKKEYLRVLSEKNITFLKT